MDDKDLRQSHNPAEDADSDAIPADDFDLSAIPMAEETVDVAAALAAVTELDLLAGGAPPAEAQPTAEDTTEAETEADYDIAPFVREERPSGQTPIVAPPPSGLARGQIASIVPSLLLIALGGGLTLLLNIGEAPPPASLLLVAGVAVVGLALVAYWQSSGGNARGSLWAGLQLIAWAAAFYVLSTMGAAFWPVLFWAAAVAFAIFAFLARPAPGRASFWALALGVVGLSAWAYTHGWLDSSILDAIRQGWPLVLIFLLWWLLAPLWHRRRATNET